VRVSNEGAQRLYYKYGFKNLGVRRNYYQDNEEDALVLWTENILALEFDELVKRRVEDLEESEDGKASQLSTTNRQSDSIRPERNRRGQQP